MPGVDLERLDAVAISPASIEKMGSAENQLWVQAMQDELDGLVAGRCLGRIPFLQYFQLFHQK